MKGRLARSALWLAAALGATAAAATNDLPEAQREGGRLVGQLLEQPPTENSAFSGVLRMRDGKGRRTEVPVKCQVIVTATNWQSVYEVVGSTNAHSAVKLTVTHNGTLPNTYELTQGDATGTCCTVSDASTSAQTMAPFAGSDFWIADLGLDFFHWPEQKVLKHEMRRGRSCKVLESTNPNSPQNGYARVVSWIDNESGGIIHAEAYDANGRLLKLFDPKEFEKVNGQWQLQEMEIRNAQTGSRTQLEFKLDTR
jgi:hypothetical protein